MSSTRDRRESTGVFSYASHAVTEVRDNEVPRPREKALAGLGISFIIPIFPSFKQPMDDAHKSSSFDFFDFRAVSQDRFEQSARLSFDVPYLVHICVFSLEIRIWGDAKISPSLLCGQCLAELQIIAVSAQRETQCFVEHDSLRLLILSTKMGISQDTAT